MQDSACLFRADQTAVFVIHSFEIVVKASRLWLLIALEAMHGIDFSNEWFGGTAWSQNSFIQ